jgi:hypothetical protein
LFSLARFSFNPKPKHMRYLFFLLTPLFGYSQLDTTLTYRQKEVHTMAFSKDTSSLTWKIDTIKYEVPFEIRIQNPAELLFTNPDGTLWKTTKIPGYVSIDGYGSFKVDSVKKSSEGDYLNYYLPKNIQFTFVVGNAYLVYPMANRKSKLIVFLCKKMG